MFFTPPPSRTRSTCLFESWVNIQLSKHIKRGFDDPPPITLGPQSQNNQNTIATNHHGRSFRTDLGTSFLARGASSGYTPGRRNEARGLVRGGGRDLPRPGQGQPSCPPWRPRSGRQPGANRFEPLDAALVANTKAL